MVEVGVGERNTEDTEEGTEEDTEDTEALFRWHGGVGLHEALMLLHIWSK